MAHAQARATHVDDFPLVCSLGTEELKTIIQDNLKARIHTEKRSIDTSKMELIVEDRQRS